MGNPILKNWLLGLNYNGVYLRGVVYNHNKIADNCRVSTSSILTATLNEDKTKVNCKTLNTEYELNVEDISIDNENTSRLSEFLSVLAKDKNLIGLEDIYKTIKFINESLQDKKKSLEDDMFYEYLTGEQNLDKELLKSIYVRVREYTKLRNKELEHTDGLHLQMDSSTWYYLKEAYYIKDCTNVDIKKDYIGEMNNTVFIKSNESDCLFRYVIKSATLLVEHMSKGFEKMIVDNIGKSDIVIEYKNKKYTCKMGETTIIEYEGD